MKKKYYWNTFYKKKKSKSSIPSSFSKFCYRQMMRNKVGKNLIDIGCGNARDSIFFYKKGLNVLGLDKSLIVIKNNKSKYKKLDQINFINKDINYYSFKKLKKFDYIYLRFFLHTINASSEKALLKNLKNIIKKNTIIMLEFRTDKDPLMKMGQIISLNERFTDHYRRFINANDLIKRFKKLNFKILYKIEKKNLAIHKNDNPVICRLIIKKK